MTKTIKLLTLFASVVALTTACTDDLFDTVSSSGTDSGGLQFEMSTVEMGHEVVSMGSTRSGSAADAGTPSESDRFKEHALEGDNTFGLKAVRQPVPLMGFNHGAVKAGSSSVGAGSPSVGESAILSQTQQPQSQTQQQQTQQQQSQTRAGANEVVKVDMTNFHDSLTIWGYTDNGTELFDQILLTKVRNWRNSVEWPYDQGDYMKFYAVAPSLESINMSATGGNFNEAPTFTYTLPEKSNELLDVLYGESENISIAAGPAGTTSTNPKDENMGKDNKHISLQFRHITTAVRFSQGNIPADVTIKSISISGSKTEGTYSPANLDDDTGTLGEWSTGAATQTYELTDDAVFNTTLFLLPQTLPTGAELQVKLTDSKSKEHTLKCSLVDDVWKKGFTIDYKITIGRIEAGYYLSTTESTVELEHSSSAVSRTLGVNSYRLYYDYSSGTQVPSYTAVTWDVAGYSETEGGSFGSKTANLSWLTDFRGVLNADNHYDGGNNATASFTVAGQTKALSATHDEVLSGNNTSADGLDLSTTDPYIGGGTHPQETANCYIVNRVGSYKFPLFYGNMTADNPSQVSCFKDHQGNTITRHKISEQIGAATISSSNHAASEYLWLRDTWGEKGIGDAEGGTLKVELLWQDVKGFITEVSLNENADGGDGNIQFTVGQSVPANAVIALKARKVNYDSAWTSSETPTVTDYGEWETLWTWHIWMTDEVYQNEGVSNGQSFDTYYVNGTESGKGDHIAEVQDYTTPSTTYKILPVNLGWVPATDEFGLYKPRSVWVQLKQTGDHAEPVVVTITQHARQELYTGTGTVYQWGRPTAFPALRDLGGNVRNVYDIDNNTITSQFVLAQAVSGSGYGGDAISNPFGVLQWEDNPNAWFNVSKNRFETDDYVTARAMWNSDTKTVYDPCPPGFRVPPAKVFYTFSKTGKTVQSGAGQLNMWPETQDLNGVTQRNGLSSNGGYFYCTKHTGDIPAADRYDAAMVYMPTTGEWQGNKSVGTQLSEVTEQINQTSTGIYWTSDYFNPYNSGTINSQGCALWITPSYTFSAGTADKPVIGFFDEADHKSNYYGHLRAIRPMKQE